MRKIRFKLWNKKEKKWVRDFAVYENGNILCWDETNNLHSNPPSEDLVLFVFGEWYPQVEGFTEDSNFEPIDKDFLK